jgi:hypothetical protein
MSVVSGKDVKLGFSLAIGFAIVAFLVGLLTKGRS